MMQDQATLSGMTTQRTLKTMSLLDVTGRGV
jgi:hypothetical protein